MALTHQEKISIINALIGNGNVIRRANEEAQQVLRRLPREAKDLTEEQARQLLGAFPGFPDEDDDHLEPWLQRFFS